MTVSWNCSHCGQHLEAEHELMGKDCPCPACKTVLQIPFPSQNSTPPALPPILPKLKKCQFCAEQIQIDAIKCKYCLSSLDAASSTEHHTKVLRDEGLRSMPNGRFTCPRCNSQKTICERDINCAIMIILFVSLGLGAIMIPFLPHHCTCRSCGHKWKT